MNERDIPKTRPVGWSGRADGGERLNLRLPTGLTARLRALAESDGYSIAEWIETWVEWEESEATEATEARAREARPVRRCGPQGEQGRICQRERGHEGPHYAGATTRAVEPVEHWRCPQCSARVPETEGPRRFCRACGWGESK